MSHAAYATTGYDWASPAQATHTTTRTLKAQVLNFFRKPATVAIVNEIPVYGAIQKIRQLQSWGANWDGVDAVAVNAEAIARAIALLDQMYSITTQLYIDWSAPNVTASPHGEVVLEWWNREKKLTVYVSEAQSDFVKVWGPDIDEEMEDGILSDGQTASLLIWLEA